MLEFMKNFDATQLLGIGVLLLVLFGDRIPWLLEKGRKMVSGIDLPNIGENTDSEDVLDVKACERLNARAIRNNCPECKKAVQDYLEHFFHKNPAA